MHGADVVDVTLEHAADEGAKLRAVHRIRGGVECQERVDRGDNATELLLDRPGLLLGVVLELGGDLLVLGVEQGVPDRQGEGDA